MCCAVDGFAMRGASPITFSATSAESRHLDEYSRSAGNSGRTAIAH